MTLGVFSVDDRVDDAVLMAAVQGAFFGANLPAARIEALIAAHVPRKHIAEVADVFQTKWWDYRRLTPGHSFLLFAHHYYKALRVAAAKVGWHRTQRGQGGAGRGILGVNTIHYKVEEIWDRDASHITGMWNAMLTCDGLGMPYDQFCQLANSAAIETMWKRLPQPRQLYSAKMGALIVPRWEALTAGRLFTSRHPLYKLDNYAGLPVQDAYRQWLIEQIEHRGDPTTSIATVVYRDPQLPEATALKHFPANSVTRARLLAA